MTKWFCLFGGIPSKHWIAANVCTMQLAIGVLFVQVSPTWGQEITASRQDFEIALPANIKSEQVQVAYFLAGAFGGSYGEKSGEPGIHEYRIDTMVEHQPAATLKAVVFAPGCQILTISIPELSRSSRKTDFTCQPVAPLAFRGRVQPESLRGREYEIDIDLPVHWIMSFFGVLDGGVPTFRIARITPDKDGSFAAELPDLVRDTVFSSFTNDYSTFDFIAREKSTGNILEPGVRPRSAYLDEVIFRPR